MSKKSMLSSSYTTIHFKKFAKKNHDEFTFTIFLKVNLDEAGLKIDYFSNSAILQK